MSCSIAHSHGKNGWVTCGECGWQKETATEIPCPSCQAPLKPGATRCGSCWAEVDLQPARPRAVCSMPGCKAAPGPAGYCPDHLAGLTPGARVYKVVTQRDEFFQSKFNPEALEQLLNQHARDGWRVVSMTATDVGSFMGTFWGKGGGAGRQELVVLLERVVG